MKPNKTMNTCPICNSEVRWRYTCHTYPGRNGSWMVCMPCDSAIEYFCTSESCDWNFTHGLNPLNPITEKNEESRPSWIVGDLEWKNNGISPVVFAEWDD